nr:forkhead box protein I3-like [Agelaius phoeniceus]
MCWRAAKGEWLRMLSPKKVNARGGRESAPGGTPSRGGQREDDAAAAGPARFGSAGRGAAAPLFAAAARGDPRRSAPAPPPPPPQRQRQPQRPPALPPGRCRYLCPLAAVPARRCAPAARPAERCGATSSAEQEETSAVLAEKASHGAVTAAACPCARALALRFSPRPLGGLDSGAGAALPGFGDRFAPGAVCCWRRQRGSVVWQVPGRLGHPCSALPPPKRDPRHRKVPVAAGGQSLSVGLMKFLERSVKTCPYTPTFPWEAHPSKLWSSQS